MQKQNEQFQKNVWKAYWRNYISTKRKRSNQEQIFVKKEPTAKDSILQDGHQENQVGKISNEVFLNPDGKKRVKTDRIAAGGFKWVSFGSLQSESKNWTNR